MSFILHKVWVLINKAAGHPPESVTNSRPMKYPYTLTAKLVQFPYKFYLKHTWFYRYYFYGLLGSLPVFIYIHRKANSPANVEKWKELKQKEKEEYENHHK